MADFDVLIVGTGHNALVCAGYLAQAGYHVGMLERRSIVGGAVATQEIIPGYRFDLGGSAHILIHHTPIVRDPFLHNMASATSTLTLSFLPLSPMVGGYLSGRTSSVHVTALQASHLRMLRTTTISSMTGGRWRRPWSNHLCTPPLRSIL